MYICPTHKFPQTYGEIERSDGEENERAAVLKANGAPPSGSGLTVAVLDWVYELETGKRCWWCGTRKV